MTLLSRPVDFIEGGAILGAGIFLTVQGPHPDLGTSPALAGASLLGVKGMTVAASHPSP